MYREPTRPGKPLSVLQAEQRNWAQLKNFGLPWVFIEPTRIHKVRIPHKGKKYKNQETFENLGAGDLAFLGNANVEMNEDDIKTLLQSVNMENDYERDIDTAPTSQRSRKVTTPPLLLSKSISNNILQTSSPKGPATDDEDLMSGRDQGNSNNIFDDFDDDKEEGDSKSEASSRELAQEDAKKIIMENLTKAREQQQAEESLGIKAFSFASIPKESEQAKDEIITPGKRKLKNFVDSISTISKEPTAINEAHQKLKPKFDETQDRLKQCEGVPRFLAYLEENHQPIPDVFKNITPAKQSKSSVK
ncbi:hypothetical protein TVAG_032930 [Trichomonas vaginalis G3]|uniref:Uncharacterized protein n=1 Tax=Trichomonas vaginalis (strain ATCC PRA-98 / G3) TaxID=412133 RepID=A2FAZ3_TRIV3|nr:hypothetical protein TVAGG3_0049350 [Trichomonas vaginalis G3]EAX97921.1 hypothetical protein TVAG_032930 [Trichomonas vaginalis G3]KAI5541280.1 hypothetical protein TVAGG3_0049350 [Trichomonas vaginalis G3]|eukprot:XP_001310851.1 hypothetical protein [Trichomonas vaginalis G3]